MTLDLSKLSPMSRFRVLEAMNTVVCRELSTIQDDLVNWQKDGSINTTAGKEMVAWKDALVDLRVAVVAMGKE